MAARYLEEFSVGQVFETEPVQLNQDDIVEFAQRTGARRASKGA